MTVVGVGIQLPSTIDAGVDNADLEVATDAIQPHMAIGINGNIYLTFIHRGNISVSTSQDGGKTFSDPVIAIDVQGQVRGGSQRGPRIGVDKNENITVTAPVTFDDKELTRKYPTSDLFLAHSTDGGKSWSKPLKVNEVTKQAPESLHWMTVSPNGIVHVAWLDRRDRGRQPGQDIYYATVVDGNIGENVKLASTVCECCAPGLAVDGSGNPLVAYREGGLKKSREIFFRRSSDGGQSFAKAIQINRQPTLEVG